MSEAILELMKGAALAAGEIILEVYENPILVTEKSDGSPVTIADEMAEECILEHLRKTGIPVLAEESVAAGNVPTLGAQYFIVDPLDGTKEFIKRNGEFTVNIALIENGRPVCGVVTAPAFGKGYVGGPQGAVSFEIANGVAGPETRISVAGKGPMNFVASRSHGHAALAEVRKSFAVAADLSVGSSLKFCLVATGDARMYPRFTPTCEWDTAAGQAVLEAAGGVVLAIDGAPLTYGKTHTRFLNPFFVAADDQKLGAQVIKRMRELAD